LHILCRGLASHFNKKTLGKDGNAIGEGRAREWGLTGTRLGIWRKGEGSMKNKRGLGDLVGANKKLRRSKRELLLKQKEGRKGGKDCPTLSSRQSEAQGFMNHKIV